MFIFLAGLALAVLIVSNQPMLGFGLVGIAVFSLVTYYYPITTLCLIVLLGQIIELELAPLLGMSTRGFQFGSQWVRLTDPFLAGMLITMAIRLFKEDGLASRFMKGHGTFLILFLVYLFLEVIRNIPSFGMNAPGELRTYYLFILLVPYATLNICSQKDRERLFVALIVIAFSYVLWGLLRAWLIFDFHFAPYEKWMSGFGSLSLLYGMFALYFGHREKLIRLPGIVVYLFYSVGVVMIIVAGTRAVWLAGFVGVVVLWVSSRTSFGKNLRQLLLIPLILLLLIPIFQYSGLGIWEFVSSRLMAFTDFESDPTAVWRFRYWLATIDQIIQHPWFGSGFGKDFGIYIPEFRSIETTSPHNLYLAVIYQVGIFGFAFYVAWVLSFAAQLKKRLASIGVDRAVVSLALIILVTIHAYGMAYSFERCFLPWIFVGLAASVLFNEEPETKDIQVEEEKRP